MLIACVGTFANLVPIDSMCPPKPGREDQITLRERLGVVGLGLMWLGKIGRGWVRFVELKRGWVRLGADGLDWLMLGLGR